MYPLYKVTGICSVGMMRAIHGERPPQLPGMWYRSCAALFVRQSWKTLAIVRIRMVAFGSIAAFSQHVRESSL